MNIKDSGPDRSLRFEVIVPAPRRDTWHAWTTKEGITSFFAPDCSIVLKVNGPYEIFFNPEAPVGERGGEGMRVLAFQPEKMLAFTWNAPPSLPDVRSQLTHVLIWFQSSDEDTTLLTLIHSGWGEGGQWEEAFSYFEHAWGNIVLPRLVYRFRHGPLDWSNPPSLQE